MCTWSRREIDGIPRAVIEVRQRPTKIVTGMESPRTIQGNSRMTEPYGFDLSGLSRYRTAPAYESGKRA
jgi:hypothetical protein